MTDLVLPTRKKVTAAPRQSAVASPTIQRPASPEKRTPGSRHPVEKARTALRVAARQRAETLIAVATEELSVTDVIEQACMEGGKALRGIGIKQLLMSQPGVGRATADRVVELLTRRSPSTTRRRLDVGWVVDPRARGQRLAYFFDIIARPNPVWAGFPFAPRPVGTSEK